MSQIGKSIERKIILVVTRNWEERIGSVSRHRISFWGDKNGVIKMF